MLQNGVPICSYCGKPGDKCICFPEDEDEEDEDEEDWGAGEVDDDE